MKSESEASFSSLEVCCCFFVRIFEAISEFPQAWDHAVSLLSLYMSLTPCALLERKKKKNVLSQVKFSQVSTKCETTGMKSFFLLM